MIFIICHFVAADQPELRNISKLLRVIADAACVELPKYYAVGIMSWFTTVVKGAK